MIQTLPGRKKSAEKHTNCFSGMLSPVFWPENNLRCNLTESYHFFFFSEIKDCGLGVVAHPYNLSYARGRGRRMSD
jgi:hypothetical protein